MVAEYELKYFEFLNYVLSIQGPQAALYQLSPNIIVVNFL